MKYFKPEYLVMIGSSDPDECHKAEEKWMAVSEAYWTAFEVLKPNLPETYLAEWERATGFHDAPVHRLSVGTTRENGVCAAIQLNLDDRFVTLKFEDVSHYQLDFAEDSQLGAGAWWGYEEIEQAENGRWIIRVLFSNNQEIELECKTIDVTVEPA